VKARAVQVRRNTIAITDAMASVTINNDIKQPQVQIHAAFSAGWTKDYTTMLCPRFAGASLPIAMVTVERAIPQTVNLSNGLLPTTGFASRMRIVAGILAPQFSLKFVQLAAFRELKYFLDKHSESTKALHAPVAWGLTNVPVQSAMYGMAIAGTYKFYDKAAPSTGGIGEFFRLKVFPGIWWTFLREGFATGGGLMLGPVVAKQIDAATDHKLPPFATKFSAGLVAGWTCAFATMLPHNCALTACRMAQQGEKPTTISCFRTVMKELGLFKALTLNFPPRCVFIATAVACLNAADVMQKPELALANL